MRTGVPAGIYRCSPAAAPLRTSVAALMTALAVLLGQSHRFLPHSLSLSLVSFVLAVAAAAAAVVAAAITQESPTQISATLSECSHVLL